MKGRSGRPWRRFVALVKETYPPVCHLCGEWIDLGLHYLDDRSWTVDHVVPLSMAPHLAEEITNARPAHRGCNIKKGADPNYRHNKPRQSRIW